jgi:cysteine desulfurase
MTGRVYLDHNASSPLRPEASAAMSEAAALLAAGQAGNASSPHAEGRRARAMIEDAREQVAALAGVPAGRVIFTSGGSEANVMALSPGWLKGDGARVFVSAIEHPSVGRGGRFGEDRVERLPVASSGVIDLDEARRRLEERRRYTGGAPFLVSLMLANNETGALQPVAELAAIAHDLGGMLHSDAIQAAGRAPLQPASRGAALISLSAHKIGGPPGVGALVVADPALHDPSPLLRGGGQERGARAGTENLIGVVGFGAAAAACAAQASDERRRLEALRDGLEAELLRISPEAVIFCRNVARTSNTTCFAVPGMSAETTVISFDINGVAISAGAACSSGKVRRSPVIEAMGAPPELSRAALRLSLGWNSTYEDVARFLLVWRETYERYKTNSKAA